MNKAKADKNMSLNHSEGLLIKMEKNEDFLVHTLLPHLMKKCNHAFKIPKLPEPFLSLDFVHDKQVTTANNSNAIKLAASEIVMAGIKSGKRLTSNDESVKKTLKLSICFKDKCIAFEPGDSFGFICPNPEKEVITLLKRLNILDVSDKTCEVIAKQNKRLPNHIPQVSTLKQVFLSNVDIRVVPKKIFLRLLAGYAEDENERLLLEFLSSQEGATFYENFIRKPSVTILDILLSFRSCAIPVERLLEHLPATKPRFYSVASSPLVSSTSFDIAFNVVEIGPSDGRCFSRKGVCTGWLEELAKRAMDKSDDALDISRLSLQENCPESSAFPISIFKRQNKNFCLSKDLEIPIIMVGPGTGVAPFISFLQHRKAQMETNVRESLFGDTWLFYGCRYKEKDYLFRSELDAFHSSDILSHLSVCFSRDDQSPEQPQRVHENIVVNAVQLVSLIDSGAHIYVCGDAINMSRDTQTAFIEVIQQTKDCSKDVAESIMKKLQDDQRYLVDAWT